MGCRFEVNAFDDPFEGADFSDSDYCGCCGEPLLDDGTCVMADDCSDCGGW